MIIIHSLVCMYKINNQKDLIKTISKHQKVFSTLVNEANTLDLIINLIYKKLKKGGKIMFCGNGGSAADAQHLTAELLVRLRPTKNRSPIPALSLAMDTSTITACSNDYDFDRLFSRNFKALHNKNDLLFVISTSGNSKNIINVLKEAKKVKINSIALLGSEGGKAKNYCDIPLIVKSNNVARIQEAHIFLGHYILEKVEDLLFK